MTVLGAAAAALIAGVVAVPFVLVVGSLALVIGMTEDPAEGLAVLAFLGLATCLIVGVVVVALLAAGCHRAVTTGALIVPTSAVVLFVYSVIIENGAFDPGGPIAATGWAVLALFVGAFAGRLLAVLAVPLLAERFH